MDSIGFKLMSTQNQFLLNLCWLSRSQSNKKIKICFKLTCRKSQHYQSFHPSSPNSCCHGGKLSQIVLPKDCNNLEDVFKALKIGKIEKVSISLSTHKYYSPRREYSLHVCR